MYLLYADESGDTGLNNSQTRYFILSGIILHELRWKNVLEEINGFRNFCKDRYGLKKREEIHASHFINNPKEVVRIKRNDRLDILRKSMRFLSGLSDVSIISVVVDKQGKDEDIFDLAWTTLIQRFENTIRNHNFPGPSNTDDRGMLIPDNTDGTKLKTIIRKMRKYNPIPNDRSMYQSGYRNMQLEYLIEDPYLKDSSDSYLHQFVDVVAYSLRQKYEPNAYMKNKGALHLYDLLDPILNKHVTRNNTWGIVEL